MKITVRAFRLAERDLHVDAKAGHLHKNFNTAPHCAQAAVAATRSQKALSAAKSESFGDNFYLQMSITRTVEFAKEDTLPATQPQLAVFHKYRLARANQHGLHVRVRISFGMPVRPFKRNQAIKRAFKIAGHVGIRALVDHDCRGGVRHVHIANAAGHPRLRNRLLNLHGDVNELGAASCFYS